MLDNIIIGLWILFLVFAVSMLYKGWKNKTYVYTFQNYSKTDIPYIIINIQGLPLNMLVDTGAGVSIILKKIVDNLEYKESPRQIELSALTDDSIPTNMVSVPFKIGNKEITEDFVVYEQENIANFQMMYGITIHGILGNEFLDKTGCKIDYSTHSIIIP